MSTITLTVIEPDYYKDFKCVGSGCRNNCCVHPWSIFVDKAIYKKVRALHSPKWLADSFGDYYKRDKSSVNNAHYAKLAYAGNGCCFQTEEGLCRLQAEVGEQYLSRTCQTYPRNNFIITSRAVAIRSLCSSCEEVARLLLCKTDPIVMETHPIEVSANHSDPFYTTAVPAEPTSPLLDYLGDILATCIALLQSREYPMDSRMMLLCIYLDKLATLERENRPDDLPAENERFVAAVNEGLYDSLLAKDFADDAAIALVRQNVFNAFGIVSTRYIPIVDWLNKGNEVDYNERKSGYNRFFEGREHFVENLMVSRFGNMLMPFFNNKPIWENAMLLCCIYTSLRFMLATTIAGGATTDVDIIDIVACFGKSFLHNSTAMQDNVKLLEINDYTSLAHMLALIKG